MSAVICVNPVSAFLCFDDVMAQEHCGLYLIIN